MPATVRDSEQTSNKRLAPSVNTWKKKKKNNALHDVGRYIKVVIFLKGESSVLVTELM